MILTIEYDVFEFDALSASTPDGIKAVFDLCIAINTTPNAGIVASVRNTED